MQFNLLIRGIFLLALAASVTGCGSKGALYLPKQEPTEPTNPSNVKPSAVDETSTSQESEEDEERK